MSVDLCQNCDSPHACGTQCPNPQRPGQVYAHELRRSGEERLPRVAHNHALAGSTPAAATTHASADDWKSAAFGDGAIQ